MDIASLRQLLFLFVFPTRISSFNHPFYLYQLFPRHPDGKRTHPIKTQNISPLQFSFPSWRFIHL